MEWRRRKGVSASPIRSGLLVYNTNGNSYEEIIAMPNLSNTAYLAKVTLASGQTLIKKAIKY